MTPAQEARQVKRVIARLTRQPISVLESLILASLAPGKYARWCERSERRFLRDLQGTQTLTLAQRRWLLALAKKYPTKSNLHFLQDTLYVIVDKWAPLSD